MSVCFHFDVLLPIDIVSFVEVGLKLDSTWPRISFFFSPSV